MVSAEFVFRKIIIREISHRLRIFLLYSFPRKSLRIITNENVRIFSIKFSFGGNLNCDTNSIHILPD